jgi:hypothetical protein
MRSRLVLSTVLVAVLAACGGSGPGATTKPGATSAGATAGQPGAKVDCAKIAAAGVQLLAVQFLAQLKTPDTIESIKNKTIGNLDLDAFLSAMSDLHALDSFSSPLGDPKAAINVYEKAAKAAKVLFATEPITQAAIDTYNTNVGPVSEFIGHQSAIAGAIDAAGC